MKYIKVSAKGAKADNLTRLSRSGFNVPPFYVVSRSEIDIKSPKDRNRLVKEFDEWRHENHISDVIVRSSASGEDSTDKSYAGQLKSVPDVRSSEEFINALETVLFSRPSSAYSKDEISVNAIVQEFIEPNLSGVVFSVNPSNGNSELVINAAEGRGTNVVEGKEVYQYFVNRLNSKNILREGSGEDILSKKLIRDIVDATIHIETLFQIPQDIEWAYKDGLLHILQTRPITQLNHLRIWDSANISESFPGIVLPLTFSIAKRGYMLAYKAQAHSAGLSWYDLTANHRVFDSMIGIFNGRMYYNLLSWYRLISLFPGSGKNQKFLDRQIGTQGRAVYQAPQRRGLWFKLKFFVRILYKTIFFSSELNRFYRRFDEFEKEMKKMPISKDLHLLIEKYTHLDQTIIPYFGKALNNDFFVMVYHGWLEELLKKWIPNKSFEISKILGSIKGVSSVGQALSLYELIELIKTDEKALGLLKVADYSALDEYIRESDLRLAIDEYLEVFGHRFAHDQKIEAPNPVLEPFGIYKMMTPYADLDIEKTKKRLTEAETNLSVAEKALHKKLGIVRRIIYRTLVKRLKHHLRIREKNRLLRGKLYAYMRGIFLDVGEALVKEGVIAEVKDVYYLEIEEIYKLIQGSLITNDFIEIVERRRKAYKEFEHIDMPVRFITKNLPSLEKIDPTLADHPHSKKGKLNGLVSSPGTVEGIVTVLDKPVIPDKPYEILVTKHTDPGWTPLIALAKGVIVERGGILSHAAIVTRELGIPSIIGVDGVTELVRDGMRVRINSSDSSVDLLD